MIWCENNTYFDAKALQIHFGCEIITIQSDLVWKRYNINSLWNKIVWLFLVQNHYNTRWFGAKTLHNLVQKRYKEILVKTRYIFLKTMCENIKTWSQDDITSTVFRPFLL